MILITLATDEHRMSPDEPDELT